MEEARVWPNCLLHHDSVFSDITQRLLAKISSWFRTWAWLIPRAYPRMDRCPIPMLLPPF